MTTPTTRTSHGSKPIRAIITTDAPRPVYGPDAKEEGFQFATQQLVITPDMPLPDRLPLILDHKWAVKNVVGSVVDLRVETISGACGSKLQAVTGELVFSTTQLARETEQNVRNGHVQSVSIGYEEHGISKLRHDESKIIKGIKYRGPGFVVSSPLLIEVSLTICPRDWNCKIILPKEENIS